MQPTTHFSDDYYQMGDASPVFQAQRDRAVNLELSGLPGTTIGNAYTAVAKVFNYTNPKNGRRETLIAVLQYLESYDLFGALRVSKAWCRCAVELLWFKPNFPRYSAVEKVARVLQLSSPAFPYAQYIRTLNFMKFGRELRDDVLSIFDRCSQLERLTLYGCAMITPTSLQRVFTCSANLIAIDLSGVTETTPEVIISLSQVARGMKGVNLSDCRVAESALLALADNCHGLVRIKLAGNALVTNAAVTALVSNCPSLVEIDLGRCPSIADVAVRDIWLHSKRIREVRLPHCTSLTDRAFPAVDPTPESEVPSRPPPLHIENSLQELRLLDLTGCSMITDATIEGIIARAPKIRTLNLAKCPALTDRSVKAICGLEKYLHHLELGHLTSLTDDSIKTLAGSCTRIRYIDLASCRNLTDVSVAALSSLTKLRRIGLVRVEKLTDEAMYSLAERHETLERIHLSHCTQISAEAIYFLLSRLLKLTHLSLSGIPGIMEHNVHGFSREAPPDLNSVQLQQFRVFSKEGIPELRNHLKEFYDTAPYSQSGAEAAGPPTTVYTVSLTGPPGSELEDCL
ncbi:SCF E3 ubiquitin ligase complex F-box protein grrA [Coprinopsis cinerea okayama7|uniref:SCF E3 ubiquitin ligase complex F-box protein grrA n=1 Tax=Coprinopsis cinerea (strain Okayama-7 / 130 / ATCC MYA-4618 / FGSC 9003) TaxID=240176 RepID=A8NYN0_COPC7|nr:SCF E3 ubiquitin ligase complex F-box protein grrA [Coprinopsis cinerea okayama7\|eukprot:XP_001837472.2 SCF E3 ubiquitin ligase complex F-box protein grrA [Coprinopsis cinerea okayama7\